MKIDLNTGSIRSESSLNMSEYCIKHEIWSVWVLFNADGLGNSPDIFQSLMNWIFYDCIDVFVVIYMDDMLISSKDEWCHLMHVGVILNRLREHQLYGETKKWNFMKTDIEFLGFFVENKGLRVNPEKVDILKT